MRLRYEKPEINFDEFEANEYIAACGDSGYEYLFECNANSGGLFNSGGSVYVDSNENGRWDKPTWDGNGDDRLGSYYPCHEKHKTKDGEVFLDGFLVADMGTKRTKVKIWRGEDGKNIHCTTNLNIDEWETAKS